MDQKQAYDRLKDTRPIIVSRMERVRQNGIKIDPVAFLGDRDTYELARLIRSTAAYLNGQEASTEE